MRSTRIPPTNVRWCNGSTWPFGGLSLGSNPGRTTNVYKLSSFCYNRYMNDETFEFNQQFELDVLLNGLTDVTMEYINKFARQKLKLTDVIIPEGVTHLDNGAFAFCCSLTRITIPDSVTSIGEYAFYDCRSLTSIMIPKSVTSIKYSSFAGCYNLVDISFKGKTVEEVRSMVDYPFSIFPEHLHALVPLEFVIIDI